MLKTATISAEALANVLDQSVDCVKLIDLAGKVLWMNSNGICAMEIDDSSAIYGREWSGLWPEDNRALITDSLARAQAGENVRFEAFCPTAKGAPRWWNVTVSRVTSPEGEHVGYLAISRDVTEAEFQRRQLAVAADELRHRLKNTYAMVCGLISVFAMGNREHETFAKEMNARLLALGTAQAFFTSPDVPRNVSELIPALVKPFDTSACTVKLDDVEPVLVERAQADAVALIIGELAMNSAKHGAMNHGGAIAVRAREENGRLMLTWEETSVQPVGQTSREGGQGLDLIAMTVEAHRGTITTSWHDHGPVVVASLPITA
ncbi:PAS domain-containing protein [Porphyrobacter sp. YT40]|uniref:PAS domain-containing protein n=1 Tax=Porphyrobacter sp. YT40 TaxID=2547601 RepID=UPI0011447A1C|nr:PAS domain-containing protein [Porphyrobacter sp. YT40]QDH33789.1 PAS domain S-box protein [Porphyrobacter sp. YT40]